MASTASGVQRIRQVAQRARDLDRATEFYGDTLGVTSLARFDPPGLVFFQLDEVRLLLEASAPSALLYLAVDDIHTSHSRLVRQGVQFVQEPQLVHRDEAGLFGPAGEEEWMAFFHDPDGNTLAITSRQQAG